MQLSLVTPPAETPISLTQAKAHLRVEHTEDDTLITALIDTAVSELDGRFGYLRRALVTQTWEYTIPFFTVGRALNLPLPPLQSVTSIKYFDANEVEQTFNASNYEVIAREFYGHVWLKNGASWPATFDKPNAVTIRFVSGFGEAVSVPANIKHAILLRLTELYHHRGDDGEAPGMSAAVHRLLQQSRTVRI